MGIRNMKDAKFEAYGVERFNFVAISNRAAEVVRNLAEGLARGSCGLGGR